MYENLSKKQEDILNFIKVYIKTKGYPPAIREICAELSINSTSTVYNHILKLEEKGYIRRDPQKNRAIEVIDLDFNSNFFKKETFDVPIVGKVTAGEPILAIENIEDSYPLPIELSYKGDIFILNVQGESMIEAGILDGDKIIIRQQQNANNGDIVVALIEDSATVKRYFKRDDYIELKPENSLMHSIIVRDVEIIGKVIGLYRNIN